ncbi:MAG: NB-ARC domain-containing protein [Gloeotrichia echinulata HAB0833]
MNFTTKPHLSTLDQEGKMFNLVSAPLTFEEALNVVDNLVVSKKRKLLSEAEILVLHGAWDNEEYEEIAKRSRYTCNYLQRRVAPPLWKLLSELIGNGAKVDKKNLRYFLEQVAGKSSRQTTANSVATNSAQVLGSKLPDVSIFYGRNKELAFLRELTLKQRCGLLVGIAGVGKSTLAAKLITEISAESQFDYIIWKSLAHAPLLPDLISELIELLQPEQQLNSIKYTQQMIPVLIKELQSYRCLIILDAFEALLHKNNHEQRLDYKLFFRRLAEELDQSCLLLVSRIFYDEIESLISAKLPVGFLKIEGLEVDAGLQLLQNQELTDEEECREIIKTYRGNPSELKTVARRINNFFAGSAEKFLERPTTLISNQFQEMLNRIFVQQILTAIQKEIMIYLAEELSSSPDGIITFTKLSFDMRGKHGDSISTSEIIRALEGLLNNSLLETNKDPVTQEISFKLQPVTKKYIKTDPLGILHSPQTAIAS